MYVINIGCIYHFITCPFYLTYYLIHFIFKIEIASLFLSIIVGIILHIIEKVALRIIDLSLEE